MEVRSELARFLRRAASAVEPRAALPSRTCTICGYVGPLAPANRRLGVKCPGCGSLERDRMLKLMLDTRGPHALGRTLHFAPEKCLTEIVRALSDEYVTTDLLRDDVDIKLNIEALEIEANSFDTIFCGHVLEHVDDRRALKEMFRVLRPGGTAILAVPLVEGWARTYEDPAVSTEPGRLLNFGQVDHLRVFGRDFRDRVRGAGFELDEFGADGPTTARHGLPWGGKIFLARRPPR